MAPGPGAGEETKEHEVTVVEVEIWSDVVCPWCYVGKRQFEEALGRFDHADQVTVSWRSYELDPTSPREVGMSMDRILERKYGMSAQQAEAANRQMTSLAAGVGLEYHLDRVRAGNTFDAHRMIHLAAAHGLGDALKERLLAAYFTEGRSVGDPATLAALAIEVGLDPTEADELLAGDAFATDVRGRRGPGGGARGHRCALLRHRRDLRGGRCPGARRAARCTGTRLVRIPPGQRARPDGNRRRGRDLLGRGLSHLTRTASEFRARPALGGRSARHLAVGVGGGQGGHDPPLIHHGLTELVPVGMFTLGQAVHLDQLLDHRIVG